jgi:hypothetical protein
MIQQTKHFKLLKKKKKFPQAVNQMLETKQQIKLHKYTSSQDQTI